MKYAFIDNFGTVLTDAIDTSQTTLPIDGDSAATIGQAMYYQNADALSLTISKQAAGLQEAEREIVLVTSVTSPDGGETYEVTVERGEEPLEFDSGTAVEARLTSAVIQNMVQGLEGGTSFGTTGAVSLGPAYTSGSSNFPESSASANGAVVIGADAYAIGDGAVVIGAGLNASIGGSAPEEVSGAGANGTGAVALGVGALAISDLSIAIGEGSQTNGLRAVALGGATAGGDGSLAAGEGSSSAGDASVALAGGNASADQSFSVGEGSNSGGQRTLTFFGGQAYADDAVAFGAGAFAGNPFTFAFGGECYAESTIAVGFGSTASGTYAVAIGSDSGATELYSVALGKNAASSVVGGMQTNALSYVPSAYDQTGEASTPPPTATRQAAMQVAIATEILDLTDDTAFVEFELPENTVLLPDEIDIVVVSVDGEGGSPTVQVGPDDTSPAAYLADSAVTKTAVGGRDTFSPLVTDGITSIRASVVTAGTGTTYSAKVIVRGYVIEV